MRWIFSERKRMRSVTVVLPASMCAMMPMLRWRWRRCRLALDGWVVVVVVMAVGLSFSRSAGAGGDRGRVARAGPRAAPLATGARRPTARARSAGATAGDLGARRVDRRAKRV